MTGSVNDLLLLFANQKYDVVCDGRRARETRDDALTAIRQVDAGAVAAKPRTSKRSLQSCDASNMSDDKDKSRPSRTRRPHSRRRSGAVNTARKTRAQRSSVVRLNNQCGSARGRMPTLELSNERFARIFPTPAW